MFSLNLESAVLKLRMHQICILLHCRMLWSVHAMPKLGRSTYLLRHLQLYLWLLLYSGVPLFLWNMWWVIGWWLHFSNLQCSFTLTSPLIPDLFDATGSQRNGLCTLRSWSTGGQSQARCVAIRFRLIWLHLSGYREGGHIRLCIIEYAHEFESLGNLSEPATFRLGYWQLCCTTRSL